LSTERAELEVSEEAPASAQALNRQRLFYLFMGGLLKPALWSAYRMKVTGFEQVPKEGGFVLASNHFSNFDPWVLAYPFFPRRHLRFMAKSELYNRVLTPMLDAAGAFPVRRGEADIDAFKTAVRLVKAGEIVAVFPQGHRQPTEEMERREARVHSGAVRIALAARAPIVPAAIKGTDRLGKLGPLATAFGRADTMDDLHALPSRKAADVATQRVMQRIYELYGTL
jgi:1-acyl-sn-glycerol-3-phosphate acyltransferase